MAKDFALRATKVTARSLGKVMSTLVAQVRHLWFNLAEMRDVDKVCFLDTPISQAGLFGDTVEDLAQQFLAVQKQTEAIQHILPRRDPPAATAPRRATPQPACHRGCPSAASRTAPPHAETTSRPAWRAPRRRVVPPVPQPAPKSSRKMMKRPWYGRPGDARNCSSDGNGEHSATPSPEGGPDRESLVSVCFCSVIGPRPRGPKGQYPMWVPLLKERAVSFLLLWHLSQLGHRVKWEKSKLSPVQRISFLGMESDSASMTARLTNERTQSVLNCLSSFKGRTVFPLKHFQKLLGHMATAISPCSPDPVCPRS